MRARRPKKPSFRDTDYQRLAQARSALRRLLALSEAAARKAGLNPQQYHALVAIRGHEGPGAPNVHHLAEDLAIAPHSAVTLLDRMVESGLVIRQREEERSEERRVGKEGRSRWS